VNAPLPKIEQPKVVEDNCRKTMKILRFCPKCQYYLSLNAEGAVRLKCQNCGFSEAFEPKTAEEALLLETQFRSGSSAGGASSGITINAYTLMDPTLPHVTTIPCPNSACASATDSARRDVIYIKYDAVNLKFLYICNVCDTKWRSKA
jgi:DNA-directed RNA polymerase subunit M/transcription elongation factor TFIIS